MEHGIVGEISTEPIRILLKEHDLKPWKKKMWCIPELTDEFVDQMMEVLELYERAYNEKEPVVCLDEKRPNYSNIYANRSPWSQEDQNESIPNTCEKEPPLSL